MCNPRYAYCVFYHLITYATDEAWTAKWLADVEVMMALALAYFL